MEQTNLSALDQAPRSSFFASSPPRANPARTHPASIFTHTAMPLDLELASRAAATLTSSFTPASGARRMVPRNELELSRPAIARAEKDGDDPSSSAAGRRRVPERGHSSTPTTLTRLFAVQAPTSPASSRAASFVRAAAGAFPFIKSLVPEADPLSSHLYVRGLLEGRYSDIRVTVLGKDYALHRIVLDQAPFFASALSEPWLESTAKEITLHPEDIDPNISTAAFELALRRLYGCADSAEEAHEALGLFATGCWLEMRDLVDSSIDCLLQQMCPRGLASIINMVTVNYYGKAGEKILTAAKSMLGRDGWLMPIRYWDEIPSEVVRDIVGGDGFYVYSEWKRWTFAKRLLNRKLRTLALEFGLVDHGTSLKKAPSLLRVKAARKLSAGVVPIGSEEINHAEPSWNAVYDHVEIKPLLELLDRGIHYMHLDFEQLQYVRTSRDVFGVPILPEGIISDALWMSLELRQTILNAKEHDEGLGLSRASEPNSPTTPGDLFGTMVHQTLSPPLDQPGRDASPHRPTLTTLPEGKPYVEIAGPEKAEITLSSVNSNSRRFGIPNVDCNIITGGQEPIITLSTTVSDGAAYPSRTRQGRTSESRPNCYTHLPPFRFAVEFPNPRFLKEEKRMYSRTIFYAGSLWNLYIRKKRSGTKTPELGVYLHRAKERSSEDDGFHMPSGSVDERIGALEREMLIRTKRRTRRGVHVREDEPDESSTSGAGDLDTALPPAVPVPRPAAHASAQALSNFITSTSTKRTRPHPDAPGFPDPGADDNSPASSPSGHSPSSSDDSDDGEDYMAATSHLRATTIPPYLDVRPTIKTYFKILCPSRGGRLLSVYESAPDNFNFAQNWGWKSASLMLEDEWFGGGGVGSRSEEAREGEGEEGQLWEGVAEGGGGFGGVAQEIGRVRGERAGDGKLRFMVVLGVV